MRSASAARERRAGTVPADGGTPGSDPGPSRRRRWPYLVGIGSGLIVLAGVWAAVFVLRLSDADHQDRAGLAALEAAKASLADEHQITTVALNDIASASRHFEAARRDLGGATVGWTRVIPVLGTQVTSLRDLTASAAQASSLVDTSLRKVQAALADRSHDGPGLLRLVEAVTQAARTADGGLSRLDLGPSRGLVEPLWKSRAKLVKDLGEARASLTRIDNGGAATVSLLAGPRTYLVLVANNAEMRAGSGMFLEAGTLSSTGGRVHLSPLVPTQDLALPRRAVPVTGDLAARWGWADVGGEWRNLALSPRFDVNARLAAAMWKRRTGQTVDGVMALDTQAVAAMLDATGPVGVKGLSITGASAEHFLLLGEYEGALGDPAAAGRVDDLGLLAGEAAAKLTTGRLDLVRLATGLSQSVSGRHLLLWSADPATEAEWQQLGAGGELGATSLGVAVENTAANKLDQFLTVTSSLTFQRAGSDTQVRVAVTVANRTPAGLPRYVEGPNANIGVVAREYAGLVAWSLPGAAVDATVAGFRDVPVAGPDGPTYLIAAPIRVRAGQSAEVVVTFLLPGEHGAVVIIPSGRIPATTWRVGPATFTDASQQRVRW